MPAANTDLARKSAPLFSTTTTGTFNIGATTLSLQTVTGLPTDTAVSLTLDAYDTNGNATPTKREVVIGVVSAGTLINCLRGKDGTTEQNHASGAVVQADAVAVDWNDYISAFLTQHNQDGTHGAITATSVTAGGVNLTTLVPVGTVLPYAGSSAPTGFFLAQGQAVSRSTYSALFAVVGTTYGVGDGSTTFNVPNIQGNVPAGYKSGDTNFGVLGGTGGEAAHTLTTNEIPSHNHAFSTYAHGTDNGVHIASANGTIVAGVGSNDSTVNTGGGAAHNNLQPYITLNYIVKY